MPVVLRIDVAETQTAEHGIKLASGF